MRVAVDLCRVTDCNVVIVKIRVVIAVTGAVLNILRGKLLVAAMSAAGGIFPIDVHLQQDGKVETDLQRAADPKLRWSIP